MSVGPIPFTAVVDYFRIYCEGDNTEFEEFAYLMRRLDNVFLDLQYKKTAGKSNGKVTGSKSNKSSLRS